jgi:hypothetical protein
MVIVAAVAGYFRVAVQSRQDGVGYRVAVTASSYDYS